MESRSSDLKDQLDEKKLEDFSLELVATDFYSLGCDEEEGRIRAYVSTWYDLFNRSIKRLWLCKALSF